MFLTLLSSPEAGVLGFAVDRKIVLGDFNVLAASTDEELACRVVTPRTLVGDELDRCSITKELLSLLEQVFLDHQGDEAQIVALLER